VPDASGDLHGVIDECSQKPGCRELKGNSKPVMSAPAMINKIQITFISLDIENYCTLRLFFDLSTLAGLSRRNLPEAGIRLLFQI
jgi:hypothetical protein